ncbi:UNVERIFIED_CONTAM: hypothetical protein GTU68_002491 [Idotea baltica]|nr:hypothetical protein [Idotea baltica]
MQLHHSKHHQTYVNNLNVAEEKLAEASTKGDVKTMINLAPAIKFNGGGHINHSIFWQNLSSQGGEPSSELIFFFGYIFYTRFNYCYLIYVHQRYFLTIMLTS